MVVITERPLWNAADTRLDELERMYENAFDAAPRTTDQADDAPLARALNGARNQPAAFDDIDAILDHADAADPRTHDQTDSAKLPICENAPDTVETRLAPRERISSKTQLAALSMPRNAALRTLAGSEIRDCIPCASVRRIAAPEAVRVESGPS